MGYRRHGERPVPRRGPDRRGHRLLPATSTSVDTGNNRVQKFSSAGTFITQWGATGTGNSQFTAPQGIAIDSSGHVYVADTGNNRIQEFDSSGTFVRTWGSAGVGDGQFTLPTGVAVDSDGNVYVADTGNSRIEKFDSSGNFIRAWGSAGTGDGQFGPTATPSLDLAVDSSDNVVVVDPTNNRVEKFRPVGTFITKWGTLGTGNGQFTTPAGVAVSSSDSIHVVDRGLVNGRVEVFHETDITDPDTSLDSGPSGVSNGDVSFTFSSAEPQLLAPGFECRLDTTDWEACGSPKAYTNLPEGSHTFRVRAVDVAGNPDPSPSVRTWMVDRTPPADHARLWPVGPHQRPIPVVRLLLGARRELPVPPRLQPALRLAELHLAGVLRDARRRPAHLRGPGHRRGRERRRDTGVHQLHR